MKYKIKTIYDDLKPEIKAVLNTNARQYASAKRLKYTLMSKTMWQELTIGEVSSMTTSVSYTHLTLPTKRIV